MNLTGEGVQVFHEEMQDSGWMLYDRPVEKKGIAKALRGWAKFHPEYAPSLKEPEKPKVTKEKPYIGKVIIEKSAKYMTDEIKNECKEQGIFWVECIPDYCPKEIFTSEELDFLAEKYQVKWN